MSAPPDDQAYKRNVLGGTLRAARERKALSQEDLADLVGVEQQTVSKWERGRIVPRGGNLVHLAQVLDLDPRHLAVLTVEPEATSPDSAPREPAISTHSGVDYSDLPEDAQERIRRFIEFERAQHGRESQR